MLTPTTQPTSSQRVQATGIQPSGTLSTGTLSTGTLPSGTLSTGTLPTGNQSTVAAFGRDTLADRAVRSIQAMVNGGPAQFAALIHPDAVNREARREPPQTRGRGPRAYFATAQWLRAAFTDLAFTIEEVVVEGDLVVTHGTMTGRHTGEFVVWTPDGTVERSFAPTGRSFTVNHAHFQRFRDGLVIEHWAVRDDQGMAMQAGWLPPTPAFLLRCAIATRRARRRSKA